MPRPWSTDVNHAQCYWQITASETGKQDRLTYAAATESRSKKLSFEDFCALREMRDDLALLE